MENAENRSESPRRTDGASAGAPSLRQIQLPPAGRISKRKPPMDIRRIKLAEGRLEYRVPSPDQAMRIYFWCSVERQHQMEQSLIERYGQYRVNFYEI